jgi:aspartyl-tRNA(Asn)/glutamyl-tRNA(Gln) amidotransferase subunit B
MAVDCEARRQIGVIEDGGTISQETRLYDAARNETRAMRTKEEAHDYRYFPDPDLLPLELTADYVEALASALPELPDQKKARFMSTFGLAGYDAASSSPARERRLLQAVVRRGDQRAGPKPPANWVINELFGRLNNEGSDIGASPVSAAVLGAILDLMAERTISGKIAKDLFEIVWSEGGDPRAVVEARGMKQVTDVSAIEKLVDEVIAASPDKVEQARAKPALIGWFVGQVMKASGGKANPQAVNDLLKAKLGL